MAIERYDIANTCGGHCWVAESAADGEFVYAHEVAKQLADRDELLEMLEAVYDWQHGHGSGVTCTETDLRKLIAKAKGGAV